MVEFSTVCGDILEGGKIALVIVEGDDEAAIAGNTGAMGFDALGLEVGMVWAGGVSVAISCFLAASASRRALASAMRRTWAISSVWVSLRPMSARHVDSMPDRQHPKRPAGMPSPKAIYQPVLSP